MGVAEKKAPRPPSTPYPTFRLPCISQHALHPRISPSQPPLNASLSSPFPPVQHLLCAQPAVLWWPSDRRLHAGAARLAAARPAQPCAVGRAWPGAVQRRWVMYGDQGAGTVKSSGSLLRALGPQQPSAVRPRVVLAHVQECVHALPAPTFRAVQAAAPATRPRRRRWSRLWSGWCRQGWSWGSAASSASTERR